MFPAEMSLTFGTLGYSVLRHANNLESVLTYEATSQMHTLVIGQARTGLSAVS